MTLEILCQARPKFLPLFFVLQHPFEPLQFSLTIPLTAFPSKFNGFVLLKMHF